MKAYLGKLIKTYICVGVLIIGDMGALVSSLLVAFFIRSWMLVKVIPLFDPIVHGLGIYLESWIIIFLWPLAFAYEGVYPSIGISFWEELKSVYKGNFFAFIAVIILTFITKTTIQFSRPVILFAFIMSILMLPLFRRIMRSLLKLSGLWTRDIILVGNRDNVKQVMCNIRKHPDWGLHPIGAVTVEGKGDLQGLPVLGPIDQLEHIDTKAHEVIVTMPGASPKELVSIVERATHLSPIIKVLPDLYGLASAGIRTHDLDGMLLLEIEDRLAQKENRIIKRIFDLACSIFGILVLLPLFLVVALLIKAESKGPVVFSHGRVGKGGREFRCYKFRTMVADAQKVLQDLLARDPQARAEWDRDFKLKNDPRITRIGSFLRRTSLDELPQLINVLKGEMSLVGPRPIVLEEVDRYGDKARYFFKVTPGITGLWQVSGRNDISYEERVLLDEYYAKNWSLWLDIEIIIRTFGAVFKKDGAY